MAYLRELQGHCSAKNCNNLAKVELMDEQNNSINKFCRKCGDRRLKQYNMRSHETGD